MFVDLLWPFCWLFTSILCYNIIQSTRFELNRYQSWRWQTVKYRFVSCTVTISSEICKNAYCGAKLILSLQLLESRDGKLLRKCFYPLFKCFNFRSDGFVFQNYFFVVNQLWARQCMCFLSKFQTYKEKLKYYLFKQLINPYFITFIINQFQESKSFMSS